MTRHRLNGLRQDVDGFVVSPVQCEPCQGIARRETFEQHRAIITLQNARDTVTAESPCNLSRLPFVSSLLDQLENDRLTSAPAESEERLLGVARLFHRDRPSASAFLEPMECVHLNPKSRETVRNML